MRSLGDIFTIFARLFLLLAFYDILKTVYNLYIKVILIKQKITKILNKCYNIDKM